MKLTFISIIFVILLQSWAYIDSHYYNSNVSQVKYSQLSPQYFEKCFKYSKSQPVGRNLSINLITSCAVGSVWCVQHNILSSSFGGQPRAITTCIVLEVSRTFLPKNSREDSVQLKLCFLFCNYLGHCSVVVKAHYYQVNCCERKHVVGHLLTISEFSPLSSVHECGSMQTGIGEVAESYILVSRQRE